MEAAEARSWTVKERAAEYIALTVLLSISARCIAMSES